MSVKYSEASHKIASKSFMCNTVLGVFLSAARGRVDCSIKLYNSTQNRMLNKKPQNEPNLKFKKNGTFIKKKDSPKFVTVHSNYYP